MRFNRLYRDGDVKPSNIYPFDLQICQNNTRSPTRIGKSAIFEQQLSDYRILCPSSNFPHFLETIQTNISALLSVLPLILPTKFTI